MVFLVVAAALVSMQIYMKRGIQAAVKGQADLLGPQVTTSNTRKVSSTDTVESESKGQTITKRVSRGGTQSISDSSASSLSGSSVTVETFDWN
ncbi:MAG: hypothetical protein AMJ95_03980 [Omnitrophica WOR_2 bacterium SM23_72]|nr:MAG: hypothetical protein AMJ95_03980 [Omnitrophica WOR_2 bacterium SM23_72]